MSNQTTSKPLAKIVTNKKQYEIRNKAYFGLQSNRIVNNKLCTVIPLEGCNLKYVAFSIEKENDEQCANKPFIFRCFLDNYVSVNKRILKKGQKRILASGDIVMSAKNIQNQYFVFYDLREIIEPSIPPNLMKNFFLERILGSGASGNTYLVHEVRTLTKLAVKKVLKTENESMNDYAFEAKIMNNLQHINIVKLITVYDQSDHSYLFTEYLNSQDLLCLINSKKNCRLEESEANDMFKQISQGLKYLHKLNICHRDIKCENIFVHKTQDNKIICKIGDFGLSAYDNNLSESCGTMFYSAPEMLNREKSSEIYSGKKCDIWSLGVVLFCMMSGKFPFHQSFIDEGSIEDQITEGIVRFRNKRIWRNVSFDSKHLICCMISKNPSDRYNIDEIQKHPWVLGRVKENPKKRPLEVTLQLNVNCSQDTVAKKQKTYHIDQENFKDKFN